MGQGCLLEAAKKPCNECPWRRNAEPGFLGPHPANEWAAMAHSGGLITCHKTIKVDKDPSQPSLRQCAGAATFRSNAAIQGQGGLENAIGPDDPENVLLPVGSSSSTIKRLRRAHLKAVELSRWYWSTTLDDGRQSASGGDRARPMDQ
ncbi:hypothetical protein GCM10009726_06250 [Nocardioides furvisabuli]|uniref:Adenine DNA glycosylase n=1 Tax=Nocardioides furvisabuli TaxID=375542 RepID=A0ABP5IEI5_9ACTN